MTSLTPPKQYKLLVMGNPLLDIQVVGNEEILKRYDLKANDSILAEEKHKPLYQELIEKYEPVYVAGGAAQNAARGAQYLLPPKSTVYIGCVGNDHLGQQIRKAAEKDGLRVEYMVLDDVPTGTCGVIITGHHRSLVANLSAAEKYSVNDLKAPGKWKLVEYADYYYIGGFFLTVSPESILEVAKHANENNKIFSMNLSAPFICQYFTQRLDEVTPYWDIIFGNETEAETYAKVHNWEITDTSEIARKIAQLPKNNPKRSRIAVITQGSNPTIVAYQDGTIREFAIIPIDEKDIVDTNGAGDAFVGGFLSQYVQGASIERSVKAGHWLANLCIQQVGPAYPQEKYVFVE